MRRNKTLLSTLSSCDRSREIWTQLNELRGLFSGDCWMEFDLRRLTDHLSALRDNLAMHYAHEWGGTGGLRQASLDSRLPREKLSLFLQEQTQIYAMISDLANEAEDALHTTDLSPKALSEIMKQFKVFDALLISHESRKSMALHAS